MKYSNIISDFTWSYSRINQFEMCPYAFLLNYIKHTPKKPMFFSEYGSFIHKLIEQYLTGKIKKEDLAGEYLARFKGEVRGVAPNKDIFKSYFEHGLSYLSNINFPYPDPLCVEHMVEFKIGDKPFTGIIDCVAKDKDGIILVDNKSRALKERSKRKKPTKSDAELDEYLRQLYLYSIPIKDTFHCYPARLEFNCYRTGQLISEPFREEELERAKQWAADSIETITNNEDWSPKLDFWKCRYLCDFCDECEYFAMSK